MSRQKLGQHFLISGKALERIATAACGERTPLVVEIGPGRGALTEKLLERADRVTTIELDTVLAQDLRERGIEVLEADALTVDFTQWGAGVLTGNLPYYVATPIISKYLRQPGLLSQAVFLIQKEVAERITAKPGTRDYGYFSVECQCLAQADYLFSVAPGAFRPPPKVDSGAIRLTPRAELPVENIDRFLGFVSTCFQHKRKTLRNNLPATASGHPFASRRAETLSVAEFVQLWRDLNPADSSA